MLWLLVYQWSKTHTPGCLLHFALTLRHPRQEGYAPTHPHTLWFALRLYRGQLGVSSTHCKVHRGYSLTSWVPGLMEVPQMVNSHLQYLGFLQFGRALSQGEREHRD